MPKRNIVWILIAVAIAVLLWKAPESRIRRDQFYNQFGPLLDVRLQVKKHYVEEIDDDVLLRGAIDGMLHRLDPYSVYFSAEENSQFEKRTQGQYPGIGVHISAAPGGGIVVTSPIEGSPAYRAGIRAGDRILKVNDKATQDLTLYECVDLISGPPGTQVRLTLSRPGSADPLELELTRAVVNVPSVRGWARDEDWHWDYVMDAGEPVGYIRLLTFDGQTDQQFHETVERLLVERQVRGLILDVRDNGGGLLEKVVAIADRFLPAGATIVSTRGRNTPEVIYAARGERRYPDVPVVVLVNGGSASASEILAGALRDHDRAVLVGEKTFGKGSVQTMHQVENGNGFIKLTTAYYHLPKGERIHGSGITPDHVVPLSAEEQTAMMTSWMAVYAAGEYPATAPHTQPATAPATQAADESAAPVATAPASDPVTAPADTAAGAEPPATSSVPSVPPPPATEPAADTARRYEIQIDPQLQEALNVLKERIRARQSPTREAA